MRSLITAFIIIFSIFLPSVSMAAGLVPCGGYNADGSSEPPCQACHFVQLLENVSDWFVIISTVIFAILFVYAGMKLVTSGGNPEAKSAAKKVIMNAFIGFVIVLAAWILIDTGMRALLDDARWTAPWNTISCTAARPAATAPTPTTPTTPSTSCTPLTPLTDPLALSMESGTTVIWDNTDPGLRNCAQSFAASAGGTITSVYRPQQYQDHLREIHSRWCGGLSTNTDPSCASVRADVSAEFSRHGLNCSWPVAVNSNHTGGLAVDISFPSGNPGTSATYNLTWFGSGDPVHYTFSAGATCP